MFDTFRCGGLLHRNATEQKKLGVRKTFSPRHTYLALVNYKSINMHAHAPCSNELETRTACIRSGKRLVFFFFTLRNGATAALVYNLGRNITTCDAAPQLQEQGCWGRFEAVRGQHAQEKTGRE